MKIEKLTKNKIRVIIDSSDFGLDSLEASHLATIALEKQDFFSSLLKKAKNEVGFETDGCKLLIETFSLNDDCIVITITKHSYLENKKPIVKRKLPGINESNSIYKFDNFEDFCELCNCIGKIDNFDIIALSKNTKLYYYKNTYYLLLKNITSSYEDKTTFYLLLSEFSKPILFSNAFENKLIEYGNVIFKKNTIEKGIKFFT